MGQCCLEEAVRASIVPKGKKKLAGRSRKGRLWPGFRPSMEIDTQVERA
jgi:hypothetical protein